ncbi:unnamed protein product, partial [Rotaria sp. Silwood2]
MLVAEGVTEDVSPGRFYFHKPGHSYRACPEARKFG